MNKAERSNLVQEILADPNARKRVWETISTIVFKEALKRPWKKVRWKAWLEAEGYAQMDDPPFKWPNDILPTDRPGW